MAKEERETEGLGSASWLHELLVTSAKFTFLTGANADFEVIPIKPADVLGLD